MLTRFKDEDAVAIDYETFYDSKDKYSLTCMTPYAYVHDKRFDPYLVSICGTGIYEKTERDSADGYTIFRALDDGRQLYVGRPERFPGWGNLEGRILLAHNAAFDEVVTDRCMELGLVPKLKNVEWEDTADLTAYLMVQRNLKSAMKYFFGEDISKAVRAGMDGRHDYELDEKDMRDLVEYGGSDAVECLDIWLALAKYWPEIERKISCQNRNAIMRGFKIDRPYAEKALKDLKLYQESALVDLPWVTRINPRTKEFYAPGSLPALRQAVVDLGITPPKSFKKDDPGFLDWSKEHDDIPFIKARAKYAGTVQHIARIENLINSADENDIVRPGLVYFGAATGRFSAGITNDDAKGAKNVNMLNLPRSPLFVGEPSVMDGKGVDLRGMYIPRKGYKYVIFDYSQIEARFSLWYVDDVEMMDCLKVEKNLYQANAVKMGWCESQCDLKHTDPQKYRLAKCCTLGLGYGMGAAKFVDSCKSQGLEFPSVPKDKWPELDRRMMFILRNVAGIRDPFDPKFEFKVGQILSSDSIVREWRSANAKIVSKWRELADVFRSRALSKQRTVSFVMPSGRVKTYWNPELVKEPTTEIGEDGKEHPSYRVAMRAIVVRGKAPKFLTGGNLMENLVQATCRDIMTYGAVEIEEKHPNWKFCWSCYDEVIFEVPDEDVDEALVEMPRIMTAGDRIKDWTEGLPLEVDGGAFDKYCK